MNTSLRLFALYQMLRGAQLSADLDLAQANYLVLAIILILNKSFLVLVGNLAAK